MLPFVAGVLSGADIRLIEVGESTNEGGVEIVDLSGVRVASPDLLELAAGLQLLAERITVSALTAGAIYQRARRDALRDQLAEQVDQSQVAAMPSTAPDVEGRDI